MSSDFKAKRLDGDLILLPDTESNEDGVYKALSTRLTDGLMYTLIGEVVVSVNPYQALPIYGNDVISRYTGATYFQNEPHIYALAEQMYKNLRDGSKDQCVLISGESGAGKTEASKKVMEYIAAVSRAGGAVGRVAGMLLGSNPILEAFGNAKTIRNDNSSRFGKYMEIVFDYRAVPFGGRITNYLLEKVRVVNRTKTERSFHIFYMMLAGLKEDEFKQLGLDRKPENYAFLKLSECYTVDGMHDAQEFERVVNAMKVLGFTPDIQNSIWRTLGGILLLGNIDFAQGQASDSSKITDMSVVEKIARLWRVNQHNLEGAITTRTFATGVGNKSTLRKGGVNSPLSVEGARFARDALAKAMYSGVFDFVVAQLNKAMAPPDALAKRLTLGILDIYGFEIFEDNSFEQFCINWCNEKLQQYFIELTLKTEQEEYEREGIEWTPVEFFNNQVIVDLIEQASGKAGAQGAAKAGLLALLNEACLLKNTSDASFLEAIVKMHSGHSHFADPNASKKGKHVDAFVLKHYAGDVIYKVAGFVDKNNDTVYSDQRRLIESSEDLVVAVMMQNAAADDVKRADSAGTHFKKSLQNLIDSLSKCRPSYVRCIKPNETKSALKADPERFRHQIRYLGLLENIRVRKAGFCNRQTYEEFLQRYKMTVPRGKGSCWPIWKGSAQEGCAVIIKHFKWTPDMYRMGKTKVFIRKPSELFALENARAQALHMVATMIQSAYRGHTHRVKFHHVMAVIRVQSVVRAREMRFSFAKLRAVAKIQASIRMQHERSLFDLIKASKMIKRNFRTFLLRRFFREMGTLYKGASRSNQWGRGFAERWPKFPRVAAAGEAKVQGLKRMEATWRCKRLLASIKGREVVYRDKVLAYDIFLDKKPWEPNAVWGDHSYLSSELNPSRPVFEAAFHKLKDGDSKVYFSDLVDKMNPDGKMVERAILLTDKGFYRMTPGKYNPDKHNALADILGISLTKQSDNLVVLHHGTSRDSVINLTFYIGSGAKKELRRTRSFSNIGGKGQSVLLAGSRQSMQVVSPANGNNNNNVDPMLGVEAKGDDESERHSEFVTQICKALKEAGLPMPTISFSDEIAVNVAKKGPAKTVMISATPNGDLPNSTWIKGKTGHVISFAKKS